MKNTFYLLFLCLFLCGCSSKYSVAGHIYICDEANLLSPYDEINFLNGRNVIFCGDTTTYTQEDHLVIIDYIDINYSLISFTGSTSCTVYSDHLIWGEHVFRKLGRHN